MRRVPSLLAALAAAAALSGCENSPSAPGGSCGAGAGVCVNFLAVEDDLLAQILCLDLVGPAYLFRPGETCSTADLAGICNRTDPGISYAVVYSTPAFTTASASEACAALGGAFQPP